MKNMGVGEVATKRDGLIRHVLEFSRTYEVPRPRRSRMARFLAGMQASNFRWTDMEALAIDVRLMLLMMSLLVACQVLLLRYFFH